MCCNRALCTPETGRYIDHVSNCPVGHTCSITKCWVNCFYRSAQRSLSLSLSLYIYIYIYSKVCSNSSESSRVVRCCLEIGPVLIWELEFLHVAIRFLDIIHRAYLVFVLHFNTLRFTEIIFVLICFQRNARLASEWGAASSRERCWRRCFTSCTEADCRVW
jgi:hypothetical protein